MSYLTLDIVSLCIMLMSVETLHGIVRAAILVPRIGKKASLKLSIISGSVLAFIVCYFMVPRTGLTKPDELIILGFIISLAMASFDILLSKILLRRSWSKIFDEFNPKKGNYLSLGLLMMISFPYFAMKLH